jgi:hypothetical protein
MNPNHKQKKSQEPDAPPWYIEACIDCLETGIGVIVVHGANPMVEHVPREHYKDLIAALEKALIQAPLTDILHKTH